MFNFFSAKEGRVDFRKYDINHFLNNSFPNLGQKLNFQTQFAVKTPKA